jgi:hypothetical protein
LTRSSGARIGVLVGAVALVAFMLWPASGGAVVGRTDYCALAQADLNTTLTQSSGASVYDADTPYGDSKCPRFIIDIWAPPWSDGWLVISHPMDIWSETTCTQLLHAAATLYKALPLATSWTQTANAIFKGTWHAEMPPWQCQFAETSGAGWTNENHVGWAAGMYHLPLSGGPYGTAYRVAIGRWLDYGWNNKLIPVEVAVVA